VVTLVINSVSLLLFEGRVSLSLKVTDQFLTAEVISCIEAAAIPRSTRTKLLNGAKVIEELSRIDVTVRDNVHVVYIFERPDAGDYTFHFQWVEIRGGITLIQHIRLGEKTGLPEDNPAPRWAS
jgi:hypothetical protein